ncbi:MAG: bL21 family ribosomal protein, partial [Gammaproteobacteria bacterium]
MLAVLKTGGKQYAVQEQDTILVERIVGDVGA